ncbi:MAG: thermonuclease family protein [Gammaproteobacteria bacterium]|nr:thermonuclease family protein [Gammaproteobacteria bacterium]
MKPFNTQRVPTGTLFLCLIVLLGSLSPALANTVSCSSNAVKQEALVSWVYDGDTVRLNDERKIRLIGINTPEMRREDRVAQPLAADAREYLLAQLKAFDNRVLLLHGPEIKDHYGRSLAHLFLPDGTNLQAQLLEKGFASSIAFPPNLQFADCYRRAEKQAQAEKLGIWQHPYFAPKKSTQLPSRFKGYTHITGKVKRIARSSKSIWINLEGRVALRVAKKDLHLFADVDFDQLEGQTISAHGWFYPYKRKTTLRLRHPSALTILP